MLLSQLPIYFNISKVTNLLPTTNNNNKDLYEKMLKVSIQYRKVQVSPSIVQFESIRCDSMGFESIRFN